MISVTYSLDTKTGEVHLAIRDEPSGEAFLFRGPVAMIESLSHDMSEAAKKIREVAAQQKITLATPPAH